MKTNLDDFQFDMQLCAAKAAELKNARIAKKLLENRINKSNFFIPEYIINNVPELDNKAMFLTGSLLSKGYSEAIRFFYAKNHDNAFYLEGNNISFYAKDTGQKLITDTIVSICLNNLPMKQASHLMEIAATSGFDLQQRQDGSCLLFFEDGLTATIIGTRVKSFRVLNLMPNSDGSDNPDIATYASFRGYKYAVMSRYYGAWSGPGQQKNRKFYAFKLDASETAWNFNNAAEAEAASKAGKERVLRDLDTISRGVISTIRAKLEQSGQKGISYAKIFKMTGRISLMLTPTTKIFTGHTFAYLVGEFGINVAQKHSTDNLEPHPASDGQLLVSAKTLSAALSTNNITFSEEDILGVLPQVRIVGGLIGKGMAIPFPEKQLNDSLYLADNANAPIRVSHEEFYTLEVTDQLKPGRVYISGDGQPDIFLDTNTLKVITKLSNDAGFDFMVATEPNGGQATLNKQDVLHMLHLKDAKEYVLEVGMRHVDHKIQDALIPHSGLVEPSSYISEMVRNIVPDYAANNRLYTELHLKTLAKDIIRDISRLNFEVDGRYARIIQDPVHMLTGAKLLNDHEIFDPENKIDHHEAEITRNPRTYSKEHYSCKTVTLQDVEARLLNMANEHKITSDMAQSFLALFSRISNGILVTPADETFANVTGGSDFDGDGVFVHYEQKYVKILQQEPQCISIIPKYKGDNSHIIHADDFSPEKFMLLSVDGTFGQKDIYGHRTFPENVGILDNKKTIITGLWFEDDNVLQDVIKRFCIPMAKTLGYFNYKGSQYDTKYYYKTMTQIGNDDIEKCTIDFYKSDMSIVSLRNYMLDCIAAFPSVIGRAIDVNKTAETVFSGLLGCIFGTNIKGQPVYGAVSGKVYSLDNIPLYAIIERKNVPYVVQAKLNYKKQGSNFLINGVTTNIRKEILAYAIQKINVLFEKAAELPWYSSCEEDLMANNTGIFSPSNTEGAFEEDLQFLKKAFYIITKSNSSHNEEFLSALANSVRCMFLNTKTGTFADEPMGRYIACLKTSLHDNEADETKPGYFRHVLLEEHIHSLINMETTAGHTVNKVFGYEAITNASCNSIVGRQFIDFLNGYGVSDNGYIIVTNQKVNGRWFVGEFNGKLTVGRTISQVLPIPKEPGKEFILLHYRSGKGGGSNLRFHARKFASKPCQLIVYKFQDKLQGMLVSDSGNGEKVRILLPGIYKYNELTDRKEKYNKPITESRYTYIASKRYLLHVNCTYTNDFWGDSITVNKQGKDMKDSRTSTIIFATFK